MFGRCDCSSATRKLVKPEQKVVVDFVAARRKRNESTFRNIADVTLKK